MSNGNFLIAYPDDATRLRDNTIAATIINGVLHIDFKNGILTKPDGTQVILRRKLTGSTHDYIRSVSFQISQPCQVALGSDTGTRIPCDNIGWNVFRDIKIEEMTIFLQQNLTPDETIFQLVASTSINWFYDVRNKKQNRVVYNDVTFTDDLQDTMIEQYTAQHEKMTLIISASTEDCSYKISTYTGYDGTAELTQVLQDWTTVSAGSVDIVHLDGAYARILVYAKNAAAGQNSTVAVTLIGN